MIDYIKYTQEGKDYELVKNPNGSWSKPAGAPTTAGNYNLNIEVSIDSKINYVDNNSPEYKGYLSIINSTEGVTQLEKLVPGFISDIDKMSELYSIENGFLDNLYMDIEMVKSNIYLTTSSNEAIERIENFLNIKGQGTLNQRKDYLKSLLRRGNKLNESSIKNMVEAITGSDCIISFFGGDEEKNPDFATDHGLLLVEVLSPEDKDYRYDDIIRVLTPLIPSHIKLTIVKFFATWENLRDNNLDWSTIANMGTWKQVKDYIPPH